MNVDASSADEQLVEACQRAVRALLEFELCHDDLEARLDCFGEFAVGHAYAALIATIAGQAGRADRRARLARSTGAMASRRERQVVEILLLAVDGDVGRAAGLSAEHTREFPLDANALALVERWSVRRERGQSPGPAPDRRAGRAQ